MQLGDWAVDQALFGAMVTVSAITCLVSPMLVRFLLTRWPQDTSKTQEP
jgi:Kef-type K+ transport system membrane component KefB